MKDERLAGVTLHIRLPLVEDYMRFRDIFGWGNVSREASSAALEKSLFSVCALYQNEFIGCGRVIGDGSIYFYIQDIMVFPGFQGLGVGRLIMDAVMDYLDKNAPVGSFIGLMAATDAAEFYENYGFKRRPEDRPGMFRIWEK